MAKDWRATKVYISSHIDSFSPLGPILLAIYSIVADDSVNGQRRSLKHSLIWVFVVLIYSKTLFSLSCCFMKMHEFKMQM